MNFIQSKLQYQTNFNCFKSFQSLLLWTIKLELTKAGLEYIRGIKSFGG